MTTPRQLTAEDIDELDPTALADFLNTARTRLEQGITSENAEQLRQRLEQLTTDTDDTNQEEE